LLLGIGMAVASGALVLGCRTSAGASSAMLRKAGAPSAAADIRPELLAEEEKPHPSAAASEIAGSLAAASDESDVDLQARAAEVMERERRLAQEEMKNGAAIWSKPAAAQRAGQASSDMQAMAGKGDPQPSYQDANRPVCVERIDDGCEAQGERVPTWTEEESGKTLASAEGEIEPRIAETLAAARMALPDKVDLAAEAVEVPGVITPQHAEAEEESFRSKGGIAQEQAAIQADGEEVAGLAQAEAAKSEQESAGESQPLAENAPSEDDKAREKVMELAAEEKIAAEERQMVAKAKFEAGLSLYRNQLYEEALVAFEEAMAADPGHRQAMAYRNKCRQLLGKPGPDKADVLIQEVAERSRAKIAAVEMQMKADIETAEKLYLAAVAPTQVRKLLPVEEQIGEALRDLDCALERIAALESMLGTSPISAEAEKEMRLRAKALRAQATEAKNRLIQQRESLDREKARQAAEQRKMETESLHRQRMEKLLQSAEFYFFRKEYDKARDLCEQILRLDPTNADALILRSRARAEAHKKADYDNATQLHDAEVIWQQEGSKLAIHPSDEVQYPEDWEQIKRRMVRQRQAASGSELERQIRDRLDSVRLTQEFNESPIVDVVKELSERGRVNIVLAGPEEVDPNTPVTLAVTEMALGKILDWIMELTGYHYEIRNEAIYISKTQARNLMMQLYPVYDLTRGGRNFYAPAAAGGEEEDEDEESTGAITNISDRIRQFVAPESWNDIPGASIELWEDNLMVMQTPEVHAQIVEFLNRLREAAKQQVLVEGRFVNVSDSFLEEIGVSWTNPRPNPNPNLTTNDQGLYNWKASDGYLSGAQNGRWHSESIQVLPGVAAASGLTTNQGLNMVYGYSSMMSPTATDPLHQFQVYAMLHALNEKRQGSVLHNPRLLVANGYNAYVQIFTLTNYVRTYTQQGDIFQPEVAQYEQGISWSVRPVISFDRKYITIRVRPRMMAFDPARSRNETMTRTTVIGGTTGARVVGVVTFPFFLPVIETTQLQTTLTVPDGGTVLLGGLIQENRLENISGIPLLSSVPFIGRALRNETRNNTKQNLVIMVSGKIIELDS